MLYKALIAMGSRCRYNRDQKEEQEMDCVKIGQLIRKLRSESGLTQLQLAEQMHVSDKAVSKWERGVSHS